MSVMIWPQSRQLAVGVALVLMVSFLVLVFRYDTPGEPKVLSVVVSEHLCERGPMFILTNPCSVKVDFAVLPYEFLGPEGWRTQTVVYPFCTQSGSLMPHESQLVGVPSSPTNSLWRVAVSCRRRLPMISWVSERLHRYPWIPSHDQKVTGPSVRTEDYKQAFEARLAESLAGRWTWRRTNDCGVLALSSDGRFVSELTNGSKEISCEGTWTVRDSTLLTTCTKSSEPEARPEENLQQFKIMSLSKQELVGYDLTASPPATNILTRLQ